MTRRGLRASLTAALDTPLTARSAPLVCSIDHVFGQNVIRFKGAALILASRCEPRDRRAWRNVRASITTSESEDLHKSTSYADL
jgi:hypothetical protein